MVALDTGETAPDFSLQAMDGNLFSLKDALARGPVDFVSDLPVCFAFPGKAS